MKFWKNLILCLVLLLAGALLTLSKLPDQKLHIVACNVGQGDGILIFKGTTQLLVDAGPDASIADCLSRHIPFWDRKIEMAVLTHPDADHYTGFLSILDSYELEKLVFSSLENSSSDFQALRDKLSVEATELLQADEDLDYKMGLIYLDIVYPDSDYKDYWDAENRNSNSVVFELKYNNFKALFTGDISPESIQKLLLLTKLDNIDYIKVPHHGSRNGLIEQLLKATKPEIGVISVGKNSFGHPHEEVLDLLKQYNVRVFRTDQKGSIEVITDGNSYKIMSN